MHVAAALLCSQLLAGPVAAASADRPNVVFILADDLGWRDTGLYGSTFYETPNIDRLATRGMHFLNAYSASPLCSPTRASILTGLHPARLRLTTPACHLRQEVLNPTVPATGPPERRALTPGTRTRLPNELTAVSEVLQQAGYATGFFGKWHLGRAPYLPEKQGFETVIGGREHPGPPGGYFAPWPIETIAPQRAGEHITDRIAQDAVRFIQAHQDEPFYLNFWDYSVHAPFEAKSELINKYRKRVQAGNPQRNPVMAAMIEPLDDAVGTILAAVEEAGVADNTIVIFTSDNGGNMYNVVEGLPPTNNAPLRNGKGSIYEGGIRVPLIVVWPGRVPRDTVCNELVTSVDYFPTLLDMLELPRPADVPFDGISLMPALQQTGPLERPGVFCHFPHYIPATRNLPATSVRQGDWKLIRFYYDETDQTDRFELYHLKDDPGETRNLDAAQPQRVAELNALISDFLTRTDALIPQPNPAYDPKVNCMGWTGNPHVRLSLDKGILTMRCMNSDPFITSPRLSGVSNATRMTLRMKSDVDGTGQVFWKTEQRMPFHRSRSATFAVNGDAQWHDYDVTLPGADVLSRLRIDPVNKPGQVQIDSVQIRNAQDKLLRKWDFECDEKR